MYDTAIEVEQSEFSFMSARNMLDKKLAFVSSF